MSSLPAMLVLLMAASAASAQPAGAPIDIVGKLDTATELLLIPVRFAGSQVWCALDTGFSRLVVVDRQKAASIGLDARPPLPLPEGTPQKTSDSSASAQVEVGPVALGQQDVIIRDLPDEAPEMECVFGAALLSRFVIEMDFQQPRARLVPHDVFTPAPGSVEVPLIFRTNPNVAFVRVTFRFADGSEQQAQLVADTGNASYAALVIDPLAARIRPRLGATAEPAGIPKGPSGPLKISAARPAAMVIGPITLDRPVIALLESDFGSGGMDDGLLGCGFFRRFTVAFDYQGHRMFLRPNARVGEPHLFDASGAGFRQQAGSFIVGTVLPDTAAARAGLRVGDTLVSIDGLSASDLTHVSLRKALSRPGDTRTLRVSRDGKLMSIAIQLTTRL